MHFFLIRFENFIRGQAALKSLNLSCVLTSKLQFNCCGTSQSALSVFSLTYCIAGMVAAYNWWYPLQTITILATVDSVRLFLLWHRIRPQTSVHVSDFSRYTEFLSHLKFELILRVLIRFQWTNSVFYIQLVFPSGWDLYFICTFIWGLIQCSSTNFRKKWCSLFEIIVEIQPSRILLIYRFFETESLIKLSSLLDDYLFWSGKNYPQSIMAVTRLN